MKTLVIVHLEPDFEAFAGDLQPLAKKVKTYSRYYDKVINVVSAPALSGTTPFNEIAHYPQEEWIWGFDAEYYTKEDPESHKEGIDYIPTTGHEYSRIEDWMKELPKYSKYTLVGGARNECLQDVYEIFNHLGLITNIKENLTF